MQLNRVLTIVVMALLLSGCFFFSNDEEKQREVAKGPEEIIKGTEKMTLSPINIVTVNNKPRWDCEIISDGIHLAECLDSNSTHILINFSIQKGYPGDNKKVPYRFYGNKKMLFSGTLNLNVVKNKELWLEVGDVRIIHFGQTSTTINIINSSDYGIAGKGYNNRIVFDPVYNRTYYFYINSDSDIYVISSSDLITWNNNTAVAVGTYDTQDFDVIVDLRDSTHTYFHLVHTEPTTDTLFYRRSETTNTPPYISISAAETPFDSSAQGGQANDDAAYPRAAMDNDNCLYIFFALEDDSEGTLEEWELLITRESKATTCGDGDWDGAADTATNYPIHSVQQWGLGGAQGLSAGINHLNGGFQLYYYSTYPSQEHLYSAFFNETSNTTGTEYKLINDQERASAAALSWGGTNAIVYSQEEGVPDDIIAHIITVPGDNSSNVVDTGVDSADGDGNNYQTTYSVVDTRASGGDDIYVFSTFFNDSDTIQMVSSADGGATWGAVTNISTGCCDDKVTGLVAVFNNVTCNITVAWIERTAGPYEHYLVTINTGGCDAVASDSCSNCDGSANCVIQCDDQCNFTTNLDLGGFNMTLNNTGTITFTGCNVTNYDWVVQQAGCNVSGYDTG